MGKNNNNKNNEQNDIAMVEEYEEDESLPSSNINNTTAATTTTNTTTTTPIPVVTPHKVVHFSINEDTISNHNNNNNNSNNNNHSTSDSYTDSETETKTILKKVKEELRNEEKNSNIENKNYLPYSVKSTTSLDLDSNKYEDNIDEINSSSEQLFRVDKAGSSGSNRLFEDGDDERDEYKYNTPNTPTPLLPNLHLDDNNNSSSSSSPTTPILSRVNSSADISKRDGMVRSSSSIDNREIDDVDVVEASLNISDNSMNTTPPSSKDTNNNKTATSTATNKIPSKKSLDGIPTLQSNAFEKSLSEKRNLFIGKVVQKVLNTLKKASSDDLSTSQKDHIIEEIFKDISSEVDEPVFQYLTTFDEKDIEKVNKEQLSQNKQQQQPQTVYYSYPCLDQFSNRQLLKPLQQQQQQLSSDQSSSNALASSTSISTSPSLGSISAGGREIYYYELISQYFLNNPDKVELFRPLLYSLWTNNQWFYLIYSSMFYSWLLEYRLSLISQLNVLIKASNRLFWYDSDHYTRKYYQVYLTIKRKLLDKSLWNGLCDASNTSSSKLDPDTVRSNLLTNRRIWIDFYHIVSVFYFYYERSNDGIDEFRVLINRQYQDFILDATQKKLISGNGDGGGTTSVLSSDDLFVRGIIKHVALIKREETLIRYIEKCLVFGEDWNLNPTTKVKLQSCLYSLTKPGSPAYVPRSVRTKSRSVLDQLFPNGKFSRHTVNLFFRLLHPYYSIGSILHWGISIFNSYIPFLDRNNNNNNAIKGASSPK